MRIYQNFKEAHGEILRDIVEMGIKVYPKTMQNKNIEGNEDFETLEVQNYIYTITGPNLADLEPTQPWADAEFAERIGSPVNPGEAWKYRPEIWTEYLTNPQHDKDTNRDAGMGFCYTYSERYQLNDQLQKIIEHLKKDPDSRQMFLSVWDPDVDCDRFGRMRVPCSLGYVFQIRNGKLNITYLMRSCDFTTHFQNDCYLTHKLQKYVAEQVGVEVGNFTHYMTSLHIYKGYAKGVF